MSPHIHQDVTNVSSVNQLLRYAAAGQLMPLLNRGFRQEEIARGAGLGNSVRNAGPVLAKALGDHFTARQLYGLDEIIGALAPDLDRAGGLSSLALRLSAERRPENGEHPAAKTRETTLIRDIALAAHVPPSWTRRMLSDQPAGEIGVLMQASGLLSEFIAVSKMDRPGAITAICERYSSEIQLMARRLTFLSVGPPTSRNYDAQTLLGMLASYSFEETRDYLERKVRYSPLGFRVWRAITKLVKLSEDGARTEALRDWVRELLRDSGELRKNSLYAGSSYDLELALAIPPEWSPPGDDWVGATLRDRVRDREATLRERGTAAMGLWQRAITEGRPDLGETEAELRKLIVEFRDPGTRPDAAAGLRWIAATLESVIDRGEAVCNVWPEVDESWYWHVQAAAGELDRIGIPAHLVTGTKNLFLHMVLQNAGAYRRHAIETVVTSGMNREVARALVSLLRTETQEAWLRVRVEAALGFVQRHDVAAPTDLTRACLRAYQNMASVAGGTAPPRSQVTELHASLFAVGDTFGADVGGDRGRDARELLRAVLTDLAGARGEQALMLRRPARAAAYLLAVTAQPRVGHRTDLSEELLAKLAGHPDPVTSRLSQWVLSFRFADDGTVRPLLAAAGLGAVDDTPY